MQTCEWNVLFSRGIKMNTTYWLIITHRLDITTSNRAYLNHSLKWIGNMSSSCLVMLSSVKAHISYCYSSYKLQYNIKTVALTKHCSVWNIFSFIFCLLKKMYTHLLLNVSTFMPMEHYNRGYQIMLTS